MNKYISFIVIDSPMNEYTNRYIQKKNNKRITNKRTKVYELTNSIALV